MKPAVYITRSAAALPNAPVENDAVEAILSAIERHRAAEELEVTR